MKSRSAFTLVELLVVVAIIALLIAIILPTLSRAEEQAKLARCAANLHAISVALTTYTSQNQDLMPSAEAFSLPTVNGGNLLGWADALYVDGDFIERTDMGGIGGAQGDGSGMNNSASWQYPAWGYGMMQCPDHSPDTQQDSSGNPTDKRYQQGYGLAWCVTSGFYNTDTSGNADPWYTHMRDLNPTHIMATEANGAMSEQGAYPVPAHMDVTTTPTYFRYGIFQRHLRGTTYTANYLFADSHVEVSADYGWAPSPLSFRSSRTWNLASYKGPSTNPNALSRIWAHGVSDQ